VVWLLGVNECGLNVVGLVGKTTCG